MSIDPREELEKLLDDISSGRVRSFESAKNAERIDQLLNSQKSSNFLKHQKQEIANLDNL